MLKLRGPIRAIEKISLDGLKVLTGVGVKADLSVADDALAAAPLPTLSLADFQCKAASLHAPKCTA